MWRGPWIETMNLFALRPVVVVLPLALCLRRPPAPPLRQCWCGRAWNWRAAGNDNVRLPALLAPKRRCRGERRAAVSPGLCGRCQRRCAPGCLAAQCCWQLTPQQHGWHWERAPQRAPPRLGRGADVVARGVPAYQGQMHPRHTRLPRMDRRRTWTRRIGARACAEN